MGEKWRAASRWMGVCCFIGTCNQADTKASRKLQPGRKPQHVKDSFYTAFATRSYVEVEWRWNWLHSRFDFLIFSFSFLGRIKLLLHGKEVFSKDNVRKCNVCCMEKWFSKDNGRKCYFCRMEKRFSKDNGRKCFPRIIGENVTPASVSRWEAQVLDPTFKMDFISFKTVFCLYSYTL